MATGCGATAAYSPHGLLVQYTIPSFLAVAKVEEKADQPTKMSTGWPPPTVSGRGGAHTTCPALMSTGMPSTGVTEPLRGGEKKQEQLHVGLEGKAGKSISCSDVCLLHFATARNSIRGRESA